MTDDIFERLGVFLLENFLLGLRFPSLLAHIDEHGLKLGHVGDVF